MENANVIVQKRIVNGGLGQNFSLKKKLITFPRSL